MGIPAINTLSQLRRELPRKLALTQVIQRLLLSNHMLANIKFARHLSSVAGIMSTEVIQGKTDRFKGITIKSTDHLSINGVDFGDKLKKSIEFWKGSSMRAAWFNIDLRLVVTIKYCR